MDGGLRTQSKAPRIRNSVAVDRLTSSVITITGIGDSTNWSKIASCCSRDVSLQSKSSRITSPCPESGGVSFGPEDRWIEHCGLRADVRSEDNFVSREHRIV